ncbi:MAG TPA: DNA translocase FtsK 4TM domain-containing protein [Thermoanaerobaculia bacterium]|jgi:S-DNA-T family DNA segregation ATPase FtsK/SpoIIIE|nr:DNA translocase FtsK 4TM domain-containing protein [Thermoanaerobaculia bacterium]
MSVAIVRKKSQTPERPTLSPEKGRELLGLMLLAAGIFLVLSLGSHHPQDPSLLHRVASDEAHARNWIGAVGAHISAVAFGFFGLTCLLIPLFLLVGGWRRLRRRGARKVVGRGFGALLLLASAPALLQIGLGRLAWSDGSIKAGGAFGELLAELLESRLNLPGTLVVLGSAVACGTALVVQSTLGDLLAAWRDRARQLWQNWTLARERRKERREKERNRRRVITKHLQRVAEEKQKNAPPPAPEAHRPSMAAASISVGAPPPDRIDLPLRVTQKKGEAEFSVRRVSAPEVELDEDFPALPGPIPEPASPYAPPAPLSPARARPAPAPQKPLPFAAEIAPGTLPPVNLLQMGDGRGAMDQAELVRLGEAIRSRCAEFGVEGSIEAISPGPVITVFELQPAPGVKVSQVVNLQDDLALALKAESVRIDRMAGRSTLGIEVPNKERGIIRLGSLLADERFRKSPSVLTMALGTDIHGEPYYADLATMPHLLVAGATGAGKSVGLQSMITSILYKATRDEVQFIFIDPKRIELGVYADIPHLKCEVVVDPKKAANALRWAVAEMERRYRLLAEVHVRSIAYYNRAISDPETQKRLALSEGSEGLFTAADLKPMPYYVVVIDELADLMMVSSSEVETAIARLAQMARAVGIHLIVATQRPSVDVLTGTIKANFPCRISFATASRHDSRTILDQVGSEKLLGKGDMLMMPPGSSRVMRLHGAYISEQETAALIRWLKKLGKPELDPEVLKAPEGDGGPGGDGGDNDDELYDEAARLVIAERQASASFLQRRMRVGFSRAARLIDMMERDGLLGPSQGSKPREVLVKPDYFEEIDVARDSEE